MEEVDAIFAGQGEIHQCDDVWNAFLQSHPGFLSGKNSGTKKNQPQGRLK